MMQSCWERWDLWTAQSNRVPTGCKLTVRYSIGGDEVITKSIFMRPVVPKQIAGLSCLGHFSLRILKSRPCPTSREENESFESMTNESSERKEPKKREPRWWESLWALLDVFLVKLLLRFFPIALVDQTKSLGNIKNIAAIGPSLQHAPSFFENSPLCMNAYSMYDPWRRSANRNVSTRTSLYENISVRIVSLVVYFTVLFYNKTVGTFNMLLLMGLGVCIA